MLNVKVGDYIKVEDGRFWMEGIVCSVGGDWDREVASLNVTSCANKECKAGTKMVVLSSDTITHLDVELENE